MFPPIGRRSKSSELLVELAKQSVAYVFNCQLSFSRICTRYEDGTFFKCRALFLDGCAHGRVFAACFADWDLEQARFTHKVAAGLTRSDINSLSTRFLTTCSKVVLARQFSFLAALPALPQLWVISDGRIKSWSVDT